MAHDQELAARETVENDPTITPSEAGALIEQAIEADEAALLEAEYQASLDEWLA